MTDEQITQLLEHLRASEKSRLREFCGELISSGVNHKDIIRVILSGVAERAVADESWLPTASIINLSDSLVHVPLQLDENKPQMMAFGERQPPFRRIELPPREPGSTEELQNRFEQAVVGHDWQLGERCLLGIAEESGMPTVFSTLLGTLLIPRYLGTTSGPWWAGVRHLLIGGMIDLWQEFGDKALLEVACHKGAKQCAKTTDAPNAETRAAITELDVAYSKLSAGFGSDGALDELAFREQVAAGNPQEAFAAVTAAWQRGVSIEQIDLALTMLCVERILRGGYGKNANWDNLKRELQATGVIRRAAVIDNLLAYKAALHAVWQIVRHGDEGLCTADELPQELEEFPIDDEQEQLGYVLNAIASPHPTLAIAQANNFLISGHNPEHLMRDTILWVNRKCCGSGYYAGQRGMLDAWKLAQHHPQRNRIPLALAGWMADYRRQHFNFKKRFGPIWGASLSDNGGLLAVRSGGTRIYDVKSGEHLMFFRGEPWRFAFHPDGRLLAAGWDGGDLQIIDLVARKTLKQWPAFPNDVSGQFVDGKFWGLEFSPDGKLLAGCSRGCNEVHVWSTSNWELKFELFGHTNDRIESVSFSPDSQRLASGGCDGTVRLWNLQTGQQELIFDKHEDDTGRIEGLQFHPDGRQIISAQCNGELKVWDSHTGEESFTVWPARDLNFTGFTRDGKQTISDHDGSVYFHDVETGELVTSFEAIKPNPDDHTIFGGTHQSRDRSTLVTAGWHGAVRVWNAVTHELIASFDLEIG